MSVRDCRYVADLLPSLYGLLDQGESEPQDPTYSLAEIVRQMNMAVDWVVQETQDADHRWLTASANATVTADNRTVSLPTDCRAVRLIREIDSAGEEIAEWLPGREEDTGVSDYRFIQLPAANTVYLTTTPKSGATLKIWYLPYKTPVFHGLARTAGSTSIQLADYELREDDIYNNATLYIYKGTGAGQSKSISDYTGWSQIATVTTWTTTPSTDSWYTSRPPLPREAEQLLIYATACALVAKNDAERYSQFMAERDLRLSKLLAAIKSWNRSGPRSMQSVMPGTHCDPFYWS